MLSDQNKALVDRYWGDTPLYLTSVENQPTPLTLSLVDKLLDLAREEGRQSSGDRVKALANRWFAEQSNYAPTDQGRAAAAAVRCCIKELEALLAPQAAPVEQEEEGEPKDFPDALKPSEIRQLAAENMKRLCRDDDDAFFLNGSAVGVTSGGGGSQVAECDDEGIAAIVCTALMDLYSGRMAQVISLIRLARTEQDPKVRDAALHAALDFATNDEEALAEGRQWAPAADQKDGAS